MKLNQVLIILSFTLLASSVFAQVKDTTAKAKQDYGPQLTFSIGALYAGGIVGFELEPQVHKNVGIQLGFGIIGYDLGLTFHFKPRLNSSFLLFNYTQQGLAENHVQSFLAGSYVYRSKKLFTCNLGIGLLNKKGPRYYDAFTDEIPVFLTYGIGLWFGAN